MLTPMDIFGSVGECMIDKFINITIVGKTESKDCSQFSLTMSWSDIYKFIDENGVVHFAYLMSWRSGSCTWMHAEDLTEAVKSSACSHFFQEYSFRFLRLIQIVVDPSGYDERTRTRD